VQRVPSVKPTVLLDLNSVRLQLLVSRRRIITTLTLRAGQYGKIPWHQRTPFQPCELRRLEIRNEHSNEHSRVDIRRSGLYSIILVTVPAPTVRPPSRIAKRILSSKATGEMSSTAMLTLSPGMIISTPSGSVMSPVTSVVRI